MLIQPVGLAWAVGALVLSAAVSCYLDLGLSRMLLWAGFRAFLQLFVLGILLNWVFGTESWIVAFLVFLLMTAVATQTISKRVSYAPYRGVMAHAFFSLVMGAWVCSFFAGEFVMTPGSWKKPEVILPFAGLLLGNALSGLSLGLAQWSRSLVDRREWLETQLALGATRWEAVLPVFRDSIATGMTPILNSMTVAGIVSLPGMLSGQLLAGADPRSAVQYQIAALFLLATSTFFGMIGALGLGYRKVFNSWHQMHPSVGHELA